MSFITKMIVKADNEVRYLTPGELEQINVFIKSGDRRLQIVKALTQGHERIVKQAANELFSNRPRLVAIGGNAHGKTMTAICLRDMDYYLRLISYSIIAGNNTPIEEIGIIGVRQMYKSLGTPIESVAESVRNLKKNAIALLSAEDVSEVSFYFDYLIDALI
jgi:allophycocyanin alpha subunit